jgi:hypothetical protein
MSVPLTREVHRDYTHGVINTVTQVLPILQTDNEEAAVALNCGLNTPAWEMTNSFYTRGTLYSIND